MHLKTRLRWAVQSCIRTQYMCQPYMENQDKLILSESPSAKEHIDGTDTPAGKGVFQEDCRIFLVFDNLLLYQPG